jgi:hypothetical protein
MIKTELVDNIKWENRTNFFLGLWVFLIPWTMSEGFKVDAVNARMWNFVMIGLIVMIASRLAIKKLVAWAEWLSLCAGVWLIASPWFLLYSDDPLLLWNSLIFGALITIFSAMTIPTVEKRMKFRFMKHKTDHDDHYLIKH